MLKIKDVRHPAVLHDTKGEKLIYNAYLRKESTAKLRMTFFRIARVFNDSQGSLKVYQFLLHFLVK